VVVTFPASRVMDALPALDLPSEAPFDRDVEHAADVTRGRSAARAA
jgi:two-component system cell cycle sensor histidine kinase PleC